MKVKTIVKHFRTLKEAEDYQMELYEQYENVRLVRFPYHEEEGTYAWEVG